MSSKSLEDISLESFKWLQNVVNVAFKNCFGNLGESESKKL